MSVDAPIGRRVEKGVVAVRMVVVVARVVVPFSSKRPSIEVSEEEPRVSSSLAISSAHIPNIHVDKRMCLRTREPNEARDERLQNSTMDNGDRQSGDEDNRPARASFVNMAIEVDTRS